uniref:Probable RNA polymerase II nuclear localization protein SLC7A6OS n=1 Tax=Strigamia maritima TaxID=126957 RepID=T1J2B4_STRMM
MALVRVKRRLDVEPAEILVVACKRFCRPDDTAGNSDTENVSGTFTFAGTLESKDKLESSEIAKVLKDARRNNPKSRVVNILDRSRKDFQKAKKNNRLKLVNSHRAQLDVNMCVFDVEDADEVPDDDDVRAAPFLQDCSGSTISCNGTELIRENSSTEQPFVYDLYFASDFRDENVILDQTFNIEQYLCPFTTDYRDDTSECEASDDQDSNEEGYYKNDYPEEDSDFETNRPYWREYEEDGVSDLLQSTHLSRLDSSDEDSETELSKTDIHYHGKSFARFKAKALKELKET